MGKREEIDRLRPAGYGGQVRRRRNNSEPSPIKQDLAGILLIALALFVLISNFSSSTGLLGLYIFKLAFRAIFGVGIYVLPFFIALYGLILLFRHEVKELTTRLSGLFILFLTFITAMQFYSPLYFKPQAKYEVIQGAGGFIGFALRLGLERSIGLTGAYILLSALTLVALLLVANITVLDILNFISWIKGSKLVSSVDMNKTLIPLGVKTSRRDDDYVSVTMTVNDFINQIPVTHQPAITSSIWANGFTVVGCINEDITLPANSNLTYKSPLAMCVGKTLTVPVGTTLTIIP